MQGVQYVPMTALYSEIPAVLVPKPIGMDVMALHSTAAATVTLPPQGLLHQKYYEPTGSEDFRSIQEPVLQPVKSSVYNFRKSKIPLYTVKRPAYYNFGRKKIAVHPPYQNQKVSSISIEPSIDLSDQIQQLQSSYPSTTPAPASTYGPAKVLDHQAHVTTYLRPKGHHPHPHYHPKDYRVYSHMHKGHVHNHHIPPGYTLHKSQYHSSAKPVYPVLKPTATSYVSSFQQEPSYNYHAYSRPDTFSTNHVRFPDSELKKSLLSAYKQHQEEILSSTRFEQPSKTHADITQAFVKEPGTISNYDASIPLKIPSKKPNKFEVKEILRNADVHFIDGTANEPIEYQPQQYVQYSPYQGLDASKAAYQALALGQVTKDTGIINGYSHGISNNHIDYYDQRDAASYVHSQQLSDELSTSESVKTPVAVIKGTHSASQAAFPVKVTRVEQEKTKQKAFTPSSTSSDWIPMSGKPVVPPVSSVSSDSSKHGDKYFADLLNKRKEGSEPTRIITSNRDIGDIISGKIPGEYSPFGQSGLRSVDAGGDIITGKIPFGQDSEMDRRKGSVIDDNPGSSGTSNLVVSSMIKFS
ncbi:UNVERIFIED_CONTAM: hypothetical protein PYX00_001814 [Menopon gallinae]|uniref:Uncharacterized protein n=1 Tax=Menopon gallinae TaxID=328185 RepID=A0AAW2IE86_9NEOP